MANLDRNIQEKWKLNLGVCILLRIRLGSGVCVIFPRHGASHKNLLVGNGNLMECFPVNKSCDSAVGIATGYVLDDRGVEFESPKGQDFSLFHIVQTGSGAHPVCSPMGTEGSFPGGKAAGALRWPLTYNYRQDAENVELYIHSPIRHHGVVLN
jgi:hypothetical protein